MERGARNVRAFRRDFPLTPSRHAESAPHDGLVADRSFQRAHLTVIAALLAFRHCPIASLPHCPVAPLPHCLIASLPHCPIAPLPHCPIAPLPHGHIAALPHCVIN